MAKNEVIDLDYLLDEEESLKRANEEQLEKAIAEEKKDKKKEKKPKEKPVITYKPVANEKCIRMKLVNGKFHSYEVTLNFKSEEVYDEVEKRHKRKINQQRKTFKDLSEAKIWRNAHETAMLDAKKKNATMKKYGVRLIDAADDYYKYMEGLVKKGLKSESYLNQLRIQTNHFKRYFNGSRTTYVKEIDTKQIREYFEFEEAHGMAKASIQKYKSHLKEIWNFMLDDKPTYEVYENVVVRAKITAPKSEEKATVLKYNQINELIDEACQLDDPTFLYIVVFSMTIGLRRGELCGLQWRDIDFKNKRATICHNRVQLVTKDTVKLPKREKVREIELHKPAYDTLVLYKEWQESILGREVKPTEYVMQWEINLLQDYVCHTGKVSRRWKEIYKVQIAKKREKEEKEPIPYGRIHDGRHTYITLCLQGIKKDDGSIIAPASYFQVFQSAGHGLPRSMENTSTTVYNEDVGDRWDITRFWEEAIYVDIAELWKSYEARRKEEYDKLTDYQKDKKKAQKEKRLAKAKEERLKSNPPEDVLNEYEE